MKILIDPGHRNNINDFGATGNGLKESELALNISKLLKKELESHGIICYMTRDAEDDVISVSARPQKAITLKSDLLISIHINSYNASSTGVEVLYKAQSELATEVCNSICKATGATNRGAKQRNDLGVLNGFKNSILVECGFISNPVDATKLKNENYQLSIAKAIAIAVVSKYKITIPSKKTNTIKVNVAGEVKDVEFINVNGNNFIKLRDLQSPRIEVDYENNMPVVRVI